MSPSHLCHLLQLSSSVSYSERPYSQCRGRRVLFCHVLLYPSCELILSTDFLPSVQCLEIQSTGPSCNFIHTILQRYVSKFVFFLFCNLQISGCIQRKKLFWALSVSLHFCPFALFCLFMFVFVCFVPFLSGYSYHII